MKLLFIIEQVLKYFDMPVEKLCKRKNSGRLCRDRNIVTARQLIYFFARKYIPQREMSYTELGKQVAGQDHATCIHGIRNIQNLYDTHEVTIYDAVQYLDSIFKRQSNLYTEIFNTEK